MIGNKHEDISSELDRYDQQLCGILLVFPVMRGTETEKVLRAPL